MTNFIVIKTIIINFSQKIPDNLYNPVADPGLPVGGVDFVGGGGLPRWLRFKNFVCQNERIWTLGGVHRAHPL